MANSRGKDGVLVKVTLSFATKRINKLMIFGEIPISELSLQQRKREL